MSVIRTATEDIIISQYQESENLINYIKALTNPFEEVVYSNRVIQITKNIDQAISDPLNIIGEIVGADRIVANASGAGYWGFYEDATSLGSADEATPTVGGIFRSEDSPASNALELTDEQYRNWIRARILVNNSPCTIDNMLQYIEYLMMGLVMPTLLVEGVATTSIVITGTLPLFQRAILAALLNTFHPIGTKLFLSDDTGNIALIGHI